LFCNALAMFTETKYLGCLSVFDQIWIC